jgi:hypothetical protein
MENSTTSAEKAEYLFGTCPYCLKQIDVHFDCKQRPYWRCGRCDIRTFGTRSALKSLQTWGWVWKEERPLPDLRAWLKRVGKAIGFSNGKKK